MSKVHKGKKLSEEHKRKIGESEMGNKYNLGKTASEETREKLRKLHNLPSRKGIPHSEETKRKMSMAHMGNKNAKGMIAWNKNKAGIYSEETIQKMREIKLGKKSPFKGKKGRYTEETLAKMRMSNKKAWEIRKQNNVA